MDRRLLTPLRLFGESLQQFAIGYLPAMAMAFVCLAIQLGLSAAIGSVWQAIVPPQSPMSLDDFLAQLGRHHDWRDDARALLRHTLGMSILFFFHALVALTLTAWLLRKRAGFTAVKVLRRAARGAGILTCGAAAVFAAGYLLDDILPATRYLSFDFSAAAMIAIWFGGTALLLPARLMGYQPSAASGFLRNTLAATIVLVPWFYASEVIGAPIRHCRECGGFFEGGCVFLPVLGAYLLGLTVSSAAISAAACMPPDPAAPPSSLERRALSPAPSRNEKPG